MFVSPRGTPGEKTLRPWWKNSNNLANMRGLKLSLVVHRKPFPNALTISGINCIWKEEVHVQSSYLPTSALDVYKTAIVLYNHRWCDHFFLGEMQFTIHQLRESDGFPGKDIPICIIFQDQRSPFLFWYSLQKDGSLGREASHLPNHTWNYPTTSWTQHATVAEKIFMQLSHILSSLCQRKGMSLLLSNESENPKVLL